MFNSYSVWFQPNYTQDSGSARYVAFCTAYACWHITDPLKFFQAVRTIPIAEQRLDDMMSSRIGLTVGKYNMSNLFSIDSQEVKVEEMENRILEEANNGLEGHYGFKIVSVGFSRVALPDANARIVYDRMKTERATIANKYRAEGREQRVSPLRSPCGLGFNAEGSGEHA